MPGHRAQGIARPAGALAASLMLVLLIAPRPAAAQNSPSLPSTTHSDAISGRTHLFEQFYLSGIARLGRGDPAGAASIFATTNEIAPELPQMHYVLALARVLADFSTREAALPLVQSAMAADPSHPLYGILSVLADPTLSQLKADGALYLTPAGAGLLQRAGALLPRSKDAYNGKYLALLLGAFEATGDAALPQRLPGFAAILGPGRAVRLPHIEETLSLGRLLVLNVSEAELKPYEARFVDRLIRSSGRAPAGPELHS
jgi:hypothetical protein